MTDQATTPTTAPQTPSSEAPTLSNDQTAAMREAWVSAGYDPAEFDRAAAAPEATASEAPSLASDGSPIQTVSDMKIPSLTGQEALEMAQALRDAGMSEARIQEALVSDGVASPPADARTDAQREFDAAFGAPRPEEYHVDYMGRPAQHLDTADLAAFNQAATSWASAVGLPVGVGEAVIERAMDVGQWWSKAAPAERTLYEREQDQELIRMAGGVDEARAAIKRAASAMADGVQAQGWDDSSMRALLDAGCAHDAGFIMHLANHAARREART